jgi:hypothetical protein
MATNVEVAREYIHAIEGGATGDALARFFTPDVAITEMPNRVAPHGRASDLAKALEAAERGASNSLRLTTVRNSHSESGGRCGRLGIAEIRRHGRKGLHSELRAT